MEVSEISPIASKVASEPFRGGDNQQTRLEQPCLRRNMDR
jgi:hypothetical protein